MRPHELGRIAIGSSFILYALVGLVERETSVTKYTLTMPLIIGTLLVVGAGVILNFRPVFWVATILLWIMFLSFAMSLGFAAYALFQGAAAQGFSSWSFSIVSIVFYSLAVMEMRILQRT